MATSWEVHGYVGGRCELHLAFGTPGEDLFVPVRRQEAPAVRFTSLEAAEKVARQQSAGPSLVWRAARADGGS
jgi:hypothetical protein